MGAAARKQAEAKDMDSTIDRWVNLICNVAAGRRPRAYDHGSWVSRSSPDSSPVANEG